MFCINCGAPLRAEMKFCNACGAPQARPAASVQTFSDAEETIVVRKREQPPMPGEKDERVVFIVRPTLFFVKIGYAAAFFGAAILGGFLLYLGAFFEFKPLMWLAVPLALLLFLIPAFYHFRRNLVRYTLTDAKLEIDSGLLGKQTQFVALNKIQDVTVSTNFRQRLFGYGNVIIDNTAAGAAPVVLKNINDPRQHADLLLREMRRLES